MTARAVRAHVVRARAMTARALWPIIVVGGVAVIVPTPAGGQGIEVLSRPIGRTPPPAYYERIRKQPDFFQIEGGWIAKTARAVEEAVPLSGTLPVAVILALFSDSEEPTLAPATQVQAALFDGPSEFGTVSEYYAEVSGGRLTVNGQTHPWIRTSLTMAEVVGDSYGLGENVKTGEYLFEAVAAADATIDFGLFDNDGPDGIPNSGDDDGTVDAVAFQYLEVAASCGGPSIWPHRSRLRFWNNNQPYVSDDPGANGEPIVVDDYTTQGAVDCSGANIQKATTISHELGHVLGLPDLYDRSQGLLPEERRWVVGCWSLMAAGSWGCGTEAREEWVRPTHLGPWEKNRLGWLDNLEVVESALDMHFTLEPVRVSEHVLKIPLERGEPADSNEYLLVEYRTKEGFDRYLPASGVLVYHIDPRIPGNRPCDTCPQVYRVSLLEADGNDSLRRTFLQGGNRGEAGDAWGVSGPGTLSANTYPTTRLHSGASSHVTIYDISLDGGVAHVTLSAIAVEVSSLTQSFLGSSSTPLTTEEREYLDRYGNGNGQYDVGDLRAYRKR